MSVFCKLFGHTWVPETIAPNRRWTTTKEGYTLKQTAIKEGDIRHLDRCARCGTERNAGPRRHDTDQADMNIEVEAKAKEES